MKELRIGLVGGLDWPHAQQMAITLNDSDPEHPKWKEVFGRTWVPEDRIPRARIVRVWDADPAKAEALAELCGIDDVVSTPEAMVGAVDAVLLPDDTSCVHGRLAAPFLDAGLPTFIDKPIAGSYDEAREIVERARKGGAPLMSLSCLRYTDQMLDVFASREALGTASTVVAVGPDREGRPIHYYGLHTVQLYVAMMGLETESVQDVGDHDHHVIKLEYSDARRGVIHLTQDAPGYVITGKFAKGRRTYEADLARSFFRMLKDVVQMFRTGEPPVPIDEMLHIIEIMSAAEKSLITGEAVSLENKVARSA